MASNFLNKQGGLPVALSEPSGRFATEDFRVARWNAGGSWDGGGVAARIALPRSNSRIEKSSHAHLRGLVLEGAI